MKNLMNYTREMLEEILPKKYNALQVIEWIYRNKVYEVDSFSNVKKDVREKLQREFVVDFIAIEKVLEDDLVKKFLFKLHDDERVEAVLMEHDYGLSVCVSSQVGCNMGCKFCESGRLKKQRDLETYEMVQQIILIEEYIGKRISSVVVMGIGEPFDNYDNVINFVKIINDAKGMAIGARHITISTCGLVPKIKEFGELDWQVNLAISLHAANDKLRNELMPVNKVYSLSVLIDSLKDYIAKTNRRVTIEYVMLKGVNDKDNDALDLVNLLKGMNVYVNLIPYNETTHIEFKKTPRDRVVAFGKILKDNGINVTIRKTFGDNIKAACGQLRSESD